MIKYLFVYHGGTHPETEEERSQVMQAWGAWFQAMGDAVVDGGAPVGKSQTVSKGTIEADGGSNPTGGYSIIQAESDSAAAELAKGCPILDAGGNIELAPIVDMKPSCD